MESACRQWGARRFRKILRIKGLGAKKKVGTGGSESATQGNRRKRVCRGRDTIVRRSSAAAIQGISGKRVCRGRDTIVRRSSVAAIQGKLEKRVCRGRDGDFL